MDFSNLDFNVERKLSTISLKDLYKRPGPIINRELVSKGEDGKFELKSPMNKIYDYVTVNEKAWNYLKHWYGFDYEIPTSDY